MTLTTSFREAFNWERETENGIYFWGGIFSQWARIPIVVDNTTYNCNEQYMMFKKAAIFGDIEAAAEIMKTKDPSKQKAIGRKVKGFTPEEWNKHCRLVVYRANLAKFTQYDDSRELLLSTGSKLIVEASAEDKIWGIGLAPQDDRVLDSSQWQGTNWLGIAIMQVRSDIRRIKEDLLTP